jgi:hypothetical protein
MRGKEYPVFKTLNQKNRANLEWLVNECLKDSFISISRGRELLGFRYMEEMRNWLNNYKGE